MSYILKHTAEVIDHKLDLIDENKNLLPYPYSAIAFPAGLEDVGDGSILTTRFGTVKKVHLGTISLYAGSYIASVEATELLDDTKAVKDHGFTLDFEGISVDASGQFALSYEDAVSVYLVAPEDGFAADLIIKPMIRKANKEAGWVPYMKTVGSYVDERFNSTNAKIRLIADRMNKPSGSVDIDTIYPIGTIFKASMRMFFNSIEELEDPTILEEVLGGIAAQIEEKGYYELFQGTAWVPLSEQNVGGDYYGLDALEWQRIDPDELDFTPPEEENYYCINCHAGYATQEEAENCTSSYGCPGNKNHKYICEGCGYEYDFEDEVATCSRSENCAAWGDYVCDNCGTIYPTPGDPTCCDKEPGCPKYSTEITVTLDENGTVSVSGIELGEVSCTLYDAETDEELYCEPTWIEGPFNEYMEPGKSYYVIISNLFDSDMNPIEGEYRSNTVTLPDEDAYTAYTVTLSANGDYTLTPSSDDACLDLYEEGNPECNNIIMAGTVDTGNLSEYMTPGHSYYIVVHTISGDNPDSTYESDHVTYLGDVSCVNHPEIDATYSWTYSNGDGSTECFCTDCASTTLTIDPARACTTCDKVLTVKEASDNYYNNCWYCDEHVPTEYCTYTYYNNEYHTKTSKTGTETQEAHYDHSGPGCICGAFPCVEHGFSCGNWFMNGESCGE